MSLRMKYFVLKPAGDDDYAIASCRAMRAYAQWLENKAIENGDEDMAQLGREVREWAFEEHRLRAERGHAAAEPTQ